MAARLGAFVDHCDIRIEGAATGPLAGLTFAVKDLYDVAGTVTGCGNPDWLRTHRPAAANAPVVDRLLAAGAALAGKTLTDELAYSLNGENHHYGTPENVAAPGRIPGGSSNGSAAAVAGGLVDFALGSDTGGSVRIPASFCGIHGIRTSHGRIPLEGIQPLAPSFDTIGWFARDPDLMIAVGKVLLDWQAPVPVDRVRVPDDLWAIVPAATRDALRPSLDRLRGPVADPEPVTRATGPDIDACREAFRVLQGREVWRVHRDWVTAHSPAFGPGVRERMAIAAGLTDIEETNARAVRDVIALRLHDLLPAGTVMAVPVAPGPAPPCNAPAASVDEVRRRILSLTCFAGLGGLPQVSLPLATVEGCPLAFSLIAGPGGDETLLALGRRLAAD